MTGMRRKPAALALALALAVPPVFLPANAIAQPTASPASPVPCPKSGEPDPRRPPRPSPPPDVPRQRIVGGPRLDSAGLVMPEGVAAPANTAISWLVADLDTGQVLGACGPHEYGTPASVQKLLVAATFIDKLDPAQMATVVHEDVNIPSDSSAVGLVEGGQYSVEVLWLGLLLDSGNDAANALARLGGGEGGLGAGVQAMNERAQGLGAYQTHAVTPSGYDAPGQFTSAYDLALIFRAAFKNENFRRYVLTRTADIPPQPPKKGFQIQNGNRLVFEYPGALGGKTGSTSLARSTYVGAAERNGRRLVATLMGAEPRPLKSWQQGAALLDWGFSLPPMPSVGRLVNPGEPLPRLPAPSSAPPSAAAASTERSAIIAVVADGRWGTMLFVGTAVAAPVVLIVIARLKRRRRRLEVSQA